MISWVRRARLIVPVAVVALVAAGCVQFSGTKEITGEGTPTGDFVVRLTCQIGDGTVTQDLTFQGEETQSSAAFNLILSEGEASCTITEIEQAGATSVTYQCGDFEFLFPLNVGEESSRTPSAGGPGMSVTRGIDPGEVDCTETPEGLIYEITLFEEVEVSISFTVINDFTPTPPTTAPPTPAAVEAVAPTPVPAQVVTFTG